MIPLISYSGILFCCLQTLVLTNDYSTNGFLSTACVTAYWVLEVILKGVPSRHQHPSQRTCEKTSSKLEEWLVIPSYPIQNGSKWFEIISSHCYQPEVTISLLQGDLPASLTPQVHCTLRTWVICWASQAIGHQSHILVVFSCFPIGKSVYFTSVAGRHPATLMQILGFPDRHSIKPSRFSASTPEKEPPNLSFGLYGGCSIQQLYNVYPYPHHAYTVQIHGLHRCLLDWQKRHIYKCSRRQSEITF